MSGVYTNNWKGAKNLMLIGAFNNNTNGRTGTTDMYTLGGVRCRPANIISPLSNIMVGINPSGTNNAVRFGTSDTAAAVTDINLGNPWSSGLSYINATAGALSWNGDTVSRTYTVTIQNTAAATVTVREFGIFAYVYTGSSYTYSLLYREVLDEPVTLTEYDSATLSFTISMELSEPV